MTEAEQLSQLKQLSSKYSRLQYCARTAPDECIWHTTVPWDTVYQYLNISDKLSPPGQKLGKNALLAANPAKQQQRRQDFIYNADKPDANLSEIYVKQSLLNL